MRKTPPFMRSFHFVFIIDLIISVLIRCGFAAGSARCRPNFGGFNQNFCKPANPRSVMQTPENEAAAPPRFRKESSDYAKKARNPASFISLLLHHRFRRSSGPHSNRATRKNLRFGVE